MRRSALRRLIDSVSSEVTLSRTPDAKSWLAAWSPRTSVQVSWPLITCAKSLLSIPSPRSTPSRVNKDVFSATACSFGRKLGFRFCWYHYLVFVRHFLTEGAETLIELCVGYTVRYVTWLLLKQFWTMSNRYNLSSNVPFLSEIPAGPMASTYFGEQRNLLFTFRTF